MLSGCKNFLIAKFGTEEHLQQLKNGTIFFNCIQTYRNDGTSYRGDDMEGCIPIDPKTLAIYNEAGENLFDIVPLPDKVVQSIVNDENLMMFCASTITKEITYGISNGIYKFKDEYIQAVKDFGDHVLLLWTVELLDHIKNATDFTGQKIGYDSGMILYRDLSDFEHTEEYRKTGSVLDPYFVKSNKYKGQNEWRVIIDGEKQSLQPNRGTGFVLETAPLEYAVLMETQAFLNGVIRFGENREL